MKLVLGFFTFLVSVAGIIFVQCYKPLNAWSTWFTVILLLGSGFLGLLILLLGDE